MIVSVAYTRVSSTEQLREGFSISAQQTILREYADKNGITIRKEFSDDESAKGTKRDGFAAMIEFVRAGGASAILVEKTDRLYRNIRDYMTLDELGVEIHFVKEGGRDRRDSDGRFMHGIRVLMARKYIENLSEEVKKGMRQKAAEGGWPTWAPLGYLNVKDESGKATIIPDPLKAPKVREIFEAAATGAYSLADLVRLADRIGLRGRRGQRITKPTMAYVLGNSAYTGTFTWSGKTYIGKYETFVPGEMFERARRALSAASRPKSATHSFAYAGLLKCGMCQRFDGEPRLFTGNKKKERYVYYSCVGCRRYLSEIVLDHETVAALKSLSIDRAVSDWIADELTRWYDTSEVRDSVRAGWLRKRIAELQALAAASYEEKLLGKVTEDAWRSVNAKWEAEAAGLRAELATVAPAMKRPEFLMAVREPLELAQTAATQFLALDAPERGALLRTCFQNLIITEGSVAITMRSPFDVLMKIAVSPDWLTNVDDFRTAILRRVA